MAARATWRGALRLSLISVPIRVFPATSQAADVRFHQIHRKCRTRIQLKKWCPHCEQEVQADEVVKGHELEDGRYAIVEEEEISAVRPESTRTIDISDLVDASAVDPIYIERTYYVAPDSKAAGEPFAVIREGLDGKAAVGRLALHGREYLVAVMPRDKALVLHTLRTKGEVRSMSGIDELAFADVKVKAPEVKLARQVLASFETGADLTSFTDHYQDKLREMLKQKRAEVVSEADGDATAKPTKVVNLMDALRKSLESATATSKGAASRGSGREANRQVKRAVKRPRMLKHPATRTRSRAS